MLSALRLLLAAVLDLPALMRWPVRRVLMKQLYFCGIEALPLLLFIGMAVGGIVVGQLHYQIGQSGEGSLKLLATITITELAPVLTAILLTARSSSAMASELAMMRFHGEFAALTRMGLPVSAYLVMPRVLAMSLATSALAFYFAAVALVTGAIGVAGFGWLTELGRLSLTMPLVTIALCLSKSAVFGAVIGVIGCLRGLAGGRSVTDIPIAASSAVVRAVLAVFAVDLLFILVGQVV